MKMQLASYLTIISTILILFFNCFSAQAQYWTNNFIEAKKAAKENKKMILMVFQGSDWSAPCLRLERDILSSKIFKDYAKSHLIMVKVDFPKENERSNDQIKHNKYLAGQYNRYGVFPYMVLVNSEGKVLYNMHYRPVNPEEYIEVLHDIIKKQNK